MSRTRRQASPQSAGWAHHLDHPHIEEWCEAAEREAHHRINDELTTEQRRREHLTPPQAAAEQQLRQQLTSPDDQSIDYTPDPFEPIEPHRDNDLGL
ncbi:hypothetical protein OHB12_07200 [Nocardia sp. NBC_01730]|uniref:hypothetical protein n=1 Tax=Nocardia sp. NBC_01730 TaxID=2975998 RepID=UPI002E146714|nr:hypothetical protein OHB12_07200 [Nocardia sp. NBC_01730]